MITTAKRNAGTTNSVRTRAPSKLSPLRLPSKNWKLRIAGMSATAGRGMRQSLPETFRLFFKRRVTERPRLLAAWKRTPGLRRYLSMCIRAREQELASAEGFGPPVLMVTLSLKLRNADSVSGSDGCFVNVKAGSLKSSRSLLSVGRFVCDESAICISSSGRRCHDPEPLESPDVGW